MKMKKSKKRVIKTYKRNKRSKSRKKTRKRLKMVGGSIYSTQEDQNVELSKENYKLQTQLAEVNKKLQICEKKLQKTHTSTTSSERGGQLSLPSQHSEEVLTDSKWSVEEISTLEDLVLEVGLPFDSLPDEYILDIVFDIFDNKDVDDLRNHWNNALVELKKLEKVVFEEGTGESTITHTLQGEKDIKGKRNITLTVLSGELVKTNRKLIVSVRDLDELLSELKVKLNISDDIFVSKETGTGKEPEPITNLDEFGSKEKVQVWSRQQPRKIKKESNKIKSVKVWKKTFWLGSTEEEVLRILGPPTNLANYGGTKKYSYITQGIRSQPHPSQWREAGGGWVQRPSNDNIIFKSGQVIEYRNDSGKLPISCGIKRISGRKIAIGSTEEEVLSILGEPTGVSDYGVGIKAYSYKLDSRDYKTDSIRFKNGRVIEYSNDSGRLPISLQKTTPISHEKTTLEYHQKELDRMEREDTLGSDVKISPTATPSVEDYKVGQEVMYISKTGKAEQKAKIVRIHKNIGPGEEPFIDIELKPGRIRQTILDRIRPI